MGIEYDFPQKGDSCLEKLPPESFPQYYIIPSLSQPKKKTHTQLPPSFPESKKTTTIHIMMMKLEKRNKKMIILN